MLAWFLTMPAIFVVVGALDQRKFRLLSDNIAPLIFAILLAGAAWIYWRFVPSTPQVGRRVLYLVVFLAGMCLLGMGAM